MKLSLIDTVFELELDQPVTIKNNSTRKMFKCYIDCIGINFHQQH